MLKPLSRAPESGSSFRPAFFFLSGEQRRALSAVYAYCRHVDDIVDVPGNRDPSGLINFWKEEIGRLYEGSPTCGISRNLLPAVREYSLEKEAFLLILEGVGMDLSVSKYETFAELEKYIYRVASAVGLLCVRIFGYEHPRSGEYAKWLGYAVQMTNILRDVSADAAGGRIYLPLEDLRRFGCAEEDIKRSAYTPSFIELMRFEAGRTLGFYEKAAGVLIPEYSGKMLPARIMAEIYSALLLKMEKAVFDIHDKKIRLETPEKIMCVLRAWRKKC